MLENYANIPSLAAFLFPKPDLIFQLDLIFTIQLDGKTNTENEEQTPKLNIPKEPVSSRLIAEMQQGNASQHHHFKNSLEKPLLYEMTENKDFPDFTVQDHKFSTIKREGIARKLEGSSGVITHLSTQPGPL